MATITEITPVARTTTEELKIGPRTTILERKPSLHRVPSAVERPMLKFGMKSGQSLVSSYVYYMSTFKKRSADQKPTYVKYYPVLPKLPNHVWIPKSYVKGGPKLPLLIDIHGGAFIIGHPAFDDRDNAIFAHTHGICVLSINYRKVPHRFPVPVEDVAALIQAVLDDPDLPVDKTNVAVIGYSAGGNLALAGPQMNGLHDKIKGVVAYYPVTDFMRNDHDRISESVAPKRLGGDILARGIKHFNWIYIGRHRPHPLDTPLLSPLWAERNKLPEKIFVLGCELDLLCGEARDAAERYAELELGESKDVVKTPLENGRSGWSCGNVTWEELKGVEHGTGYNQRWPYEFGERKRLWKRRTLEIHANVAEWLFREVYKTESTAKVES